MNIIEEFIEKRVSEFIGKRVKEIAQEKDECITIKFDDETSIDISIGMFNTSCHCHPEYEYYLDIETSL